ncbi:MAG: redoxin domain-containing protein [Proteobacteria bacterium]|nr:redoxin domain-containing protein [Pseudomonadota bacterium]
MSPSPIKSWKDVVTLLVLLAVVVGLYFFVVRGPGFVPELAKVGEPAPEFTLPTLDGKSARLADYRGKVVLLNFWATWCPPCIWEMPSMESLYQRFKGREFEILGVSIDAKGESVVRPFVDDHGITFPVLLDPDSQVYKRYGVTGVPESFIIDKDGKVASKIVGARNWMEKEWLDYFDRLIGKTGTG